MLPSDIPETIRIGKEAWVRAMRWTEANPAQEQWGANLDRITFATQTEPRVSLQFWSSGRLTPDPKDWFLRRIEFNVVPKRSFETASAYWVATKGRDKFWEPGDKLYEPPQNLHTLIATMSWGKRRPALEAAARNHPDFAQAYEQIMRELGLSKIGHHEIHRDIGWEECISTDEKLLKRLKKE